MKNQNYGSSHNIHINLETQDFNFEIIIPNGNVCPDYDTHLTEAWSSPKALIHLAEVTEPLMREVAPFMGYVTLDIHDFSFAYECATVYSCHGFDVPSNLTQQACFYVIPPIRSVE